MHLKRYALLAFLSLITISIANSALATKVRGEKTPGNFSHKFLLTIHPKGLGPIQLGNLKEEVWRKNE